MKNILIINGHPNKNSFCSALSEKYKNGVLSIGNAVEVLNLYDLTFDLNLKEGYENTVALEPDLILAQQKIKNANHIVIIHPVWWGSVPAVLKGFVDRIFLPGFGFKYRENSVMWDRLLEGRTARIIYTLDYPVWYYRFVLSEPAVKQLKKMTLEFCGIKPVSTTAIGPIRKSSDKQRKEWLDEVFQQAIND